MRYFLVLPILPLVVGLLAWVHLDTDAALRVVILESLDAGTADDVLPIFEIELSGQLALDRRGARFEHIRVGPARAPRRPELDRLAGADLVVSFGTVAAETGNRALLGTAIPHLFAFVPRHLALTLTDEATRAERAPTTGLAGDLPRGAALAIASRLLASRDARSLNIGIVHRVRDPGSAQTRRVLAEAAETPGFVSVPFVVPEGSDVATIRDGVGAAAAEAALREPPVDAFWLALDATAPLDRLVRIIEQRTGLPVVYAPSEAAVAAGALMSLAPEPRSIAREAAVLAKQLLDGATPTDVPVRAPSRVDFSLNLETADALGIVAGHELMELARGHLFR